MHTSTPMPIMVTLTEAANMTMIAMTRHHMDTLTTRAMHMTQATSMTLAMHTTRATSMTQDTHTDMITTITRRVSMTTADTTTLIMDTTTLITNTITMWNTENMVMITERCTSQCVT